MFSPKENNNYSVIFDAERMKYSHTGLYHYCLHLAKALVSNKAGNVDLSIYAPEKAAELFNVTVKPQSSLHKYWMPFAKNYDVWHCTYQGSNYFPFSSKKKIVLTVHDLNFLLDGNKAAAKKKKYLAALQKKINRADAIAAISSFTKAELKQHLDLNGKEPIVIYNGSNIDDSIKPVTPSNIPLKPFVFTVGTIIHKKNFHVLPGLLKGNDYLLVIAGIVQRKEYKVKIIEQAKKLGVLDRVIFTNGISEPEKIWYLQNCKAFAFPSLAEGFGLPVIEAMHFGKPVLLSNHTSLPEIGGEYAYYFNNFEPEHMSFLLQHAVEDFVHLQKAEATKAWAAKFNWNEAAKQYLQLYQQLLQ